MLMLQIFVDRFTLTEQLETFRVQLAKRKSETPQFIELEELSDDEDEGQTERDPIYISEDSDSELTQSTRATSRRNQQSRNQERGGKGMTLEREESNEGNDDVEDNGVEEQDEDLGDDEGNEANLPRNSEDIIQEAQREREELLTYRRQQSESMAKSRRARQSEMVSGFVREMRKRRADTEMDLG